MSDMTLLPEPVTAVGLYNTVMVALAGRDPRNGMIMKPTWRGYKARMDRARVRLEEIIDLANEGLQYRRNKVGMPF